MLRLNSYFCSFPLFHPILSVLVEEDPDFDDGDLKFKSKKVLWVPKASRTLNASGVASGLNGTAGAALPTLVDLCLDVLERNLSRIDHVGNVPWELLARAMRHASAEDLGRIERYNPVGWFLVSNSPALASKSFDLSSDILSIERLPLCLC